jgi:hypothetical protein
MKYYLLLELLSSSYSSWWKIETSSFTGTVSFSYEKLELLTTIKMPPKETIYWCTLHRTPVFNGTQHAVAVIDWSKLKETLFDHQFISNKAVQFPCSLVLF